MNTEGNNIPKPQAGVSTSSRVIRGGRGRGFWSRRPYFDRGSRRNRPKPDTVPVKGFRDSLQSTELFTAPKSKSNDQIQVISIVNPLQYPGWRLYFPTEMFTELSPLVSQIEAFAKHVAKHTHLYPLNQILKQRWFQVSLQSITKDEEFVLSWNNFSQQLHETPTTVLSCLGVAMHRAITTMVIETSKDNTNDAISLSCSSYKGRVRRIPKIIPRPVDCFPITSVADGVALKNYDKLIVVHGRVANISSDETKCTWVAYKCKRCGHEQAIRQAEYYPTKPLRCRIQCNSKKSFVELRSSPYTRIENIQMLKLLETSLVCSLGSDSIDIELRDDLVDQVCPDNVISVTGVLRMKSLTQQNQERSKNNFYIEAVSIVKHAKFEQTRPHHTSQKDFEIIQMITREPNCLRLLVQSIAPEMCGHEMAKLATLLSLFGGLGSKLHDSFSELNMLLVGNPGVEKTNLLQNAAVISRQGNLVTVKSQASLTPTIQQTKSTSGLNASSVISTGSILSHCFIDGLDKLSSNQEALIHTMQSKSITSRSTDAALNVDAKSSIIAAANPVGGHYDSSKLLRENIRLNPAFLSLFHLVFVLFDKADKDRDNVLTEHIKALHSGMKKILSIPTRYNLSLKPSDDSMAPPEEIELMEKLKLTSNEQLDLLPKVLLTKYISYARQNIKPLLTQEAVDVIKTFYNRLRGEKNDEERFSITTRQLEGLIMLTQARARAELCLEAQEEHARDVIELAQYSFVNTHVIDKLNTTLNGSIAGTSHGSQVKKFIQLLQLRSNAMGKKVFEFEELKDMASHAGIRCGVVNLVDIVNMQGYLLKKGPNLYEVRTQ